MVFFLIVPSVMVVTILLVRGILNQIGLKISYSAFILSAVLSFVVDLLAIEFAPLPNQDYFLRLLILVFVAAIFVTALNYFLLAKEPVEISPPIQPKSEEEVESSPSIANPKTEEAQLIKKVAGRLKTESNGKFFKDTPVTQNSNETLEEILDRADSEKNHGHIHSAISAYKKALELYGNDDYAPFVAIDLGNIYKEQAAYTNAIKTYEQALNLPAVKRNAATKKEFQNNLIYLRTVHLVLLKYDALSIPFSKIPQNYLQEIETEFQAAQAEFGQKN